MKSNLIRYLWFLLSIAFVLSVQDSAEAQNLFTTARTNGFGTPSVVVGFAINDLDPIDTGADYNMFTIRGSIGIGRKTDIFGSFNSVLGRSNTNTNFLAWSFGLHHQFIRTPVVDLGGIVRLRTNNTDERRFEDALLDFGGIISLSATPFHPYYALVFSRPFGFDLTSDFQRSSVFGVEVPLGDIPRIIGEFSLGDRRSFGGALKLEF
jgi:hypothetical protein